MTTPTQQWSDWIPWHGGPCPIHDPDVSIGIRLRAGDEVACVTGPATNWRWSNTNTKGDIVAYRHIIRPTEAPAEPSTSLVEAAEAMAAALTALLRRDERNTCQHEDTHRGGTLWEICDACGAKWADDQGGKPQWSDPPEWVQARDALTLYRSTSKEG